MYVLEISDEVKCNHPERGFHDSLEARILLVDENAFSGDLAQNIASLRLDRIANTVRDDFLIILEGTYIITLNRSESP
jgi:hypothetical protein